MNILKWSHFPGADVASYNIYRSILGFSFPKRTPSELSGLTMQLRMNSGASQTILFDGVTETIDKINSVLMGGRAYPSLRDTNNLILRSDIRTTPGSVAVLGGTALTLFGQSTRTIYEKSENKLIATLPATADHMEFQDEDGVCQDWYAISTTSSQGSESLMTPFRQPMTYTGDLCVIEGLVTNLQGVRMPDVEVKATIIKFPEAIGKTPQITREPITVLTGSDGRFCIPLLQGVLVQFEIPAAEFIRNITVPEKSCEFITDLQVDLDYRYPLEVSL